MVLVTAGVALAGCKSGSGTGSTGSAAIPVTVVTVERDDVPVLVRALGTVEAVSSVAIVPQVTGRITSVEFLEGQRVKKGDVLFTIDTRPYTASLASAQADLLKNQALAEQARGQASRYASLAEEGVVSAEEAMQRQAELKSLDAQVAAARAKIEASRLDVQLATVRSPIEGRTGRLLITVGNVVRANEPEPLVVVRSLAPVKVRFSIDQELFPTLRQRMAQEPLEVTATPRGDGAKSASGQLNFFDNAVDPATGTLTLLATFPNEQEALWPGGFTDVVLTLDVDRNVLVVPERAIAEGQEGPYAFMVDAQGVAHKRRVRLHRRSDERAVIAEGLSLGEQVVVDGLIRLRDGTKVVATPARTIVRGEDDSQ